MKSFKQIYQELLSENKVYKKGDTVSLLSFDRKQTGKAKVKSVTKAKPNKFGIKNYYVTDKGTFSDMEVDGTSAYKLRFKGNTEKEVMKALGEKAPNTDDAMKRYKAGKAGFTDIAHLKAKGLIARADGTKRKSPKYEDAKLDEKQIKGLKNKADKTGIPYGILKQVYDRGMAAWKTGHRPGAGQHQWAFARVNSFATKSKGTWGGADKDLADKVRAGKKR